MVSRHAFLISAGATFAMPGVASAAESIGVLYAGSLVTIMERRVVPALAKQGLDVRGEGKGSAALANLIRSGLRSPDVFISADAKILDGMIGASGGNFVSWYLNFATTRLVIGYAAASPFAHDFVLANRGEKKLTSALLAPGLRLGRTDPALDPKGYRTILACELLEAQLGPPGFAARLLGDPRNPAQIVPEETLLARLEGGDLDAGFLYSTESVARGVPELELPKSVNLGDPSQSAVYASASVTIEGVKRTGAPAIYAMTIPDAAPNKEGAVAFIDFLLAGAGREILAQSGMTLFRPLPGGNRAAIPAKLAPLLG